MNVPTFTYLYCRNGHMLYGNGTIAEKHCRTCGQPFLHKCDKCSVQLNNTFASSVYFTSGTPTNFPQRPDYCPSCGSAYPWIGKPPDQLSTFWDRLHPSVVGVSRKRFEDGHFADAVESAFKALNQSVKQIVKTRTGQEYDGANLMRRAFSPNNPIISLENLDTESGRNIQQGYMDIFAGAMTGIRNPKAHEIINLDEPRAIHYLHLASLLFYALEERK